VHIAHNPGVSRAALARGLAVSPQAAGKLTAQLHAGGLTVRTEHRAGQPTRHAVTPDGVRTLAATAHVIQDVTQDVAKRLAPAHRHLLAQIVGHLLASCKDV
jgi:hypothetical protein